LSVIISWETHHVTNVLGILLRGKLGDRGEGNAVISMLSEGDVEQTGVEMW